MGDAMHPDERRQQRRQREWQRRRRHPEWQVRRQLRCKRRGMSVQLMHAWPVGGRLDGGPRQKLAQWVHRDDLFPLDMRRQCQCPQWLPGDVTALHCRPAEGVPLRLQRWWPLWGG